LCAPEPTNTASYLKVNIYPYDSYSLTGNMSCCGFRCTL